MVEREKSRRRSTSEHSMAGRAYMYEEGSAVRKLQETSRNQRNEQGITAVHTGKNADRPLLLNLGYVLFMTAAAAVTVFMCVNYLQLQTASTKLQKEVTSMEAQLDAAILENNADYQRIINSVDMEKVKNIAMNDMGMVYAKKSQIVTYEMYDSDYVRQYSEVPTE